MLRRLSQDKTSGLTEERYAGSSAGGSRVAQLELALKGETDSLRNYLSYCVLQEENPGTLRPWPLRSCTRTITGG